MSSREFTIHLDVESDKQLANILFEKSKGLAVSFAHHMGIQFVKHDKDANTITVRATSKDVETKAKRAFAMLSGSVAAGHYVNKNTIMKFVNEVNPPSTGAKFNKAANENAPRKSGFVAKSKKQELQAELTKQNDFTFAIGPAGTGKTHVAMAMAVEALRNGDVSKILLARPAIEAAEKLGFQPGDQNAKMAPYMRPLYDELDKAFGPGKYKEMMETGVIEVVPIGFMRGRTFESAFIIIDEAQNCQYRHLKMALTRLGEGSKMVITGDPGQVDLEPVSLSGLIKIADWLDGAEGVGRMEYTAEDVIRHPTVKRVVDILESKEAKEPKIAPAARKTRSLGR